MRIEMVIYSVRVGLASNFEVGDFEVPTSRIKTTNLVSEKLLFMSNQVDTRLSSFNTSRYIKWTVLSG